MICNKAIALLGLQIVRQIWTADLGSPMRTVARDTELCQLKNLYRVGASAVVRQGIAKHDKVCLRSVSESQQAAEAHGELERNHDGLLLNKSASSPINKFARQFCPFCFVEIRPVVSC